MITFSNTLSKRKTGTVGNVLLCCCFVLSSKDKKSGEFIRRLLLRCDLSSAECRVWKKQK